VAAYITKFWRALTRTRLENMIAGRYLHWNDAKDFPIRLQEAAERSDALKAHPYARN